MKAREKSITESGRFRRIAGLIAFVFFLSNGAALPASFAGTGPLTQSDRQPPAPVLRFSPVPDAAAARSLPARQEIPSGVAIRDPKPLSLPSRVSQVKTARDNGKPNKENIAALYLNLLGREAKKDEIKAWTKSRLSLSQIRNLLSVSAERQKAIAQMVRDYLGREPKAGEAFQIAKAGAKLADIRQQIMTGAERQKAISQIVRDYLGREPKAGEALQIAKAGAKLADIRQQIMLGTERLAAIDQMCRDFLYRDAKSGEASTWAATGLNLAVIKDQIFASEEYKRLNPQPGQFIAGACLLGDVSSATLSRTCVGRIGTAEGPREIYAYSDGTRITHSYPGPESVLLYDPRTRVQKFVPYGAYAYQGAITAEKFSPDGKYLILPDYSEKEITVVSVTDGTVIGKTERPELYMQTFGYSYLVFREFKFLSNTQLQVTTWENLTFLLDIIPGKALSLKLVGQPPVPSGWSAVPGNPLFAYKTVSLGWRGTAPFEIHVANLVTGESKFIGLSSISPSGSFAILNVTADSTTGGPVVIYEVLNPWAKSSVISLTKWREPTQTLSMINTWNQWDAAGQATGESILLSASYTDTLAILNLKNGTTVHIDLNSLKAIESTMANTIHADSTLTSGDISLFSGVYEVTTMGSVGTPWATQQSASLYTFGYNFQILNGWALGMTSFDDFGTIPVETKDFTEISQLTLGLKLSAGIGIVVVELEDAAGQKVSVPLADVGTTEQFYRIATAPLFSANAAFDPRHVKNMNVALHEDSVTQMGGQLQVRFGRHKYRSFAIADPSLGIQDVTALPGIKNLAPVYDPATGASAGVTQQSASLYTLDYNLPAVDSPGTYNPAGWAAALTSFDDFGTPGTVETRDLSQLTDFVIGLQNTGSYSISIRLEFEDAAGRRAMINLGANVTERFSRIVLQELLETNPDFDLRHVKNMCVVVEGLRYMLQKGQLRVRLGGYTYTPQIASNPALTAADLQGLPAGQAGAPRNTVVYADGASATVTDRDRGFSLTYNTGTVGWAGGGLTFDDFGTPELETADLKTVPAVRFEISGTVPAGRLKVEFVDADGGKGTAYLNAVSTASGRVWEIPLADLQGVDLGRIRLIYFIAEGLHQQGEVLIRYLKAGL